MLAQIHPKHKEEFANDFKELFNLNLMEDNPEEVVKRMEKLCKEWTKLYPALSKKLANVDLSYHTI